MQWIIHYNAKKIRNTISRQVRDLAQKAKWSKIFRRKRIQKPFRTTCGKVSFSNLYGFSPLWIKRCFYNSPAWLNDLSHCAHVCSFSPLWMRRCLLRFPAWLNVLSQFAQVYIFSHCVSSSASSDVQIDWTFCCNLNRCLSLSHCASASASSDFQLYWTLCWNKCWNLLWNVNWSRRAEGDRRLRNMFPLLQRNQCWNMVATESEAHVRRTWGAREAHVRRTWGALNWALAQHWVSEPKVGQCMGLP